LLDWTVRRRKQVVRRSRKKKKTGSKKIQKKFIHSFYSICIFLLNLKNLSYSLPKKEEEFDSNFISHLKN
jgi:hypothetical protein